MVGAPEYELASVGLFLSCGEPKLLRRVLLSYGYAEDALDEALEHRLLAYGSPTPLQQYAVVSQEGAAAPARARPAGVGLRLVGTALARGQRAALVLPERNTALVPSEPRIERLQFGIESP
jgi:hypothetical protein